MLWPVKRNPKNFETALQEFEKLVERMEAGDMDLEEALRSYERGMELGRICQSALDEAEQRIEVLTQAPPTHPRACTADR